MKDLMYFSDSLNSISETLIQTFDFKIVFTVSSAMEENSLQMRKFLLVKFTLHLDENLHFCKMQECFTKEPSRNGDI